MSDSRRHRYARLLRWYPQFWHEEYGSIVLDTLEQHAGEQGIARPSVAEAWSLRAHGLGARATRRWAAVAAAAALMALLAATWLLLSNATTFPGAEVVRVLLAVFIGPLGLALAAVVLLHCAGQLSAPAALSTAGFALPACGFAALAAASWSIGFDEADAGLGLSWFGASTLLFLMLAWLAGTISFVAPLAAVLGTKRPATIRRVQSTVVAAFLVPVVGVLVLTGQIVLILGAAVLLVVALRPSRAMRRAATKEIARAPVRSPLSGPAPALTRRQYVAVGAAALLSLIAGGGSTVFALTGSRWIPALDDSTHAMNLGMAAGALAAIPAVVVAGILLTPRYGAVLRWSALACCASLVMEATAQNFGAGHPLQWPVVLVAAMLMGITIALPLGALIPGRSSLRIGMTAVLCLAGSPVGLLVVTMAGFIAPLGAAALLVWSVVRLSAWGKQSVPLSVNRQGG